MSRRQVLIFISVLVACAGCDQATKEIAQSQPDSWRPVGRHVLEGIGNKIDIYAWNGQFQ